MRKIDDNSTTQMTFREDPQLGWIIGLSIVILGVMNFYYNKGFISLFNASGILVGLIQFYFSSLVKTAVIDKNRRTVRLVSIPLFGSLKRMSMTLFKDEIVEVKLNGFKDDDDDQVYRPVLITASGETVEISHPMTLRDEMEAITEEIREFLGFSGDAVENNEAQVE